MKRIFSVLLVVAVLCTTLLPVAFADDVVSVARVGETVIELDAYYPGYASGNANASGDSLVRVSDVAVPTFASLTETTITLDVEEAGSYKIEWVANAYVNADSAAMTLALNDADVFKVISQNGTTIEDGRGNAATALSASSKSTDAGYTVGIGPAETPYAMKKYNSVVTLNEGTNTIKLYAHSISDWNIYNLVMDYVKLTSLVRNVAPKGETVIELDDYYAQYDAGAVVANANASGASLVNAKDKFKFNGPNDPPYTDRITVPVDRTITLEVPVTGTYTLEWVANAYYDADSSPMTLYVDDAETFKVAASGSSASTDAGYTVGSGPDGALTYVMKKYTKNIVLLEGTHTIKLSILGGQQWGAYNFVVDYVKLTSQIKSVDVSAAATTRIELDQFYGVGAAEGWNNSTHTDDTGKASGGAYTFFFQGNVISVRDNYKQRSFYVNAPKAGEYDITFVASPDTYENGKSRVELFINDAEVIDCVDNTPDSDPTPGEYFPGGAVNHDMKLYTATVNLVAGENKVTINVNAEPTYGTALCFAVDYLEFAPVLPVAVAAEGDTVINLDSYYGKYDEAVVVANANANGEYLVKAANKVKFNGPNDPATTADKKVTPVVRTITIDVEKAGDYTIEWVANATNNSDSSAMTLAVNGADVFDVPAQSGTTIKDGHGEDTTMAKVSASTDAGYTVDVLNDATTLQYVMKKYNSIVSLNEGENTITLYTLGGLQWGNYNFVMDYVKLAPVAPVAVAAEGDTVINLDSYYGVTAPAVVVADGNAVGGYLVKADNLGSFNRAGEPTGDNRKTTPVVRTITLDVEAAGDYDIEWVASAQYDGDTSAMTLAVNGSDVFKVLSDNGTIRRDGRGNNYADLSETSPSVDAGYTVTIAGERPYVMKKYSSTVALNEGENTITLYVIGGLNWGDYTFVMDYVKLAPAAEEELVDSVTLDASSNTASATVYYDASYTGQVIIAVYDEHNRLIGFNNAAIAADNATISASYNGTVESVKVYVWDNLTSCKPLAAIKTPAIQ